ncbi:hypothetical protein ZTR_02233 [Talaromyces verruculosus]|nr:hypothetical protein ZTR_02233 [Talaromyces verruculosus]
MEASADSKSHEPGLSPSLISIPQLSPELEDASQYSVRAVVTLVWPFSSSNRLFSLLLAEPDFRLRNQNGQIRVTFCGRCAEEVARTKIGIGDTVTLSLQGAQWTENQKGQSTPGKSLGWELQFKNRVKLEATRNGKKTAALDYLQPESPRKDALTVEPTTPALLSGRLPSPILSEERWETPAFLRTKRLRSWSPVPSTYDLFAEEDGYVPGIGRKRPRFSFPSNGWRLLDESDDQAEDNIGNDENWFESDEELLDQDADDGNDEALAEPTYEAVESADTVPITSSTEDVAYNRVQLVESDTPGQETQNTYANAQEIELITPALEETAVEPNLPNTQFSFATPRLNPITSSTLPTPSPLVQTPVDSTKISQEPSSDIPTSQPQFSYSQSTDTVDHDYHYKVSSDAYKTAISGDNKSHESDNQTRNMNSQDLESELRSEHLEIDTLEVIQDGNSLQSIHGHFSSSQFTCINEFGVEKGDKPETANEAEGDADDLVFDLTHDGRVVHSDGEPMGAYDSVFEDGAEADPHGSESEGVVDDETSSQVQIIEVDDTSPGGYGQGSSRAEEAEEEESDFEDRYSSDEAEGEAHENLSEQSEYSDTGTGYEESAGEDHRETLTSRTPQRIVHPEVIVLDSDSEDEPPMVNAANDKGSLSHHEDDEDEIASQDIDHMEEDRDAYSDEEEEEDIMPSETQALGYENAGHEHLHAYEVYDLDERGGAQAEESYEHEAPTSDMDKIVSLGGDFGSPPRQSDTPKTRPDATSDTSGVDNDMVTREEQENNNLLNMEDMPDEDNEFDIKEEQSPVLWDQPLSQEQATSSTRIMQRLAYRTVSPAPVPTPPSTVNDESQYTYVESTIPTSVDHGSSPESKITEAEISHNRRRRWIDGSDERHLQDSTRQLPKEEHLVHELTDEDEVASEKTDEVILIEDYSIRPTENGSHEAAEVEQPDLQFDPTSPIIETPKLPVYATLALLGERFNETVDVIAVAVDVSPVEPSTTKTEEYHMRLRVTDISMAGTTVIVEITQPSEISLPRVTEGDVVLLHAFLVHNDYNSIELLSSDHSGWAIISPSADQPHATHSNVTLGERERGYVKLLQSWFREDGAAMAADHMLQLSISQEEKQPSPFSAASSDAGSLESTRSGPVSRSRPRRRKSHRRVTIHELRDGRRYTEFGWLDSDSIHELRDGTVYAHSFDRDR